MDDLSLFPISNGKHHYSNENDNEMFDEEENEQPQEQQPVHHERGGRRKGVPRRLKLSPDIPKPPSQRLLPISSTKIVAASVHHHEQPILTSDQEDENEIEEIYHQNQIEQNYLQLDIQSKHFVDKNNNHEEYEEILEIVDDILADIVTIIVKDIKQQRKKLNGHIHPKQQTNGISKITNGKHSSNGLSTKSKLADPSTLFTDLTKSMHLNSEQQLVKHKLSPTSSFSSPPPVKRQKTLETSSPLAHQQLLWEMTQQLMMSTGANDTDNLTAMNSSLLKQQLLGLSQLDSAPKRKNPPSSVSSKPQSQSPGMTASSNTNLIPPSSSSSSSSPHPSTSPSPFERGNFAPRRRGRPPKYVTDRTLPGLSALDLDPSGLSTPYEQLFAAIENGINTSPSGASVAAFQTALASMLGQQAALSIPPPSAAPRNGAPASMVKNSAGQTRHSLPASSKLPHDIGSGAGLDIPLMAAKKRGPGRPPKSQMLFDPHQILQTTQRLNSPTNNNYPPTMVPSSPNSFNLNAAFVEMLQQQQQQH